MWMNLKVKNQLLVRNSESHKEVIRGIEFACNIVRRSHANITRNEFAND